VNLAGTPIRELPDMTIPSPLSTPFSPSGALMLMRCSVGQVSGQCAVSTATGRVVARYPFVGYDGSAEYPAQDIGWYDDQHFLAWIGEGPGHYELVTVSLAGVATSVLAVDYSLDIPQLYITRARAS
jgi:hypothetical protein